MTANVISNGHGESGPREIETRLFINNGLVKAQKEGTFEVINPATEVITAHVQEATDTDVELAVAAAEAAFPACRGIGLCALSALYGGQGSRHSRRIPSPDRQLCEHHPPTFVWCLRGHNPMECASHDDDLQDAAGSDRRQHSSRGVVAKAPLTSLLIAKLADEAGFLAGVINILNGHGAVCGAALSAHPRMRKISFTGSVRAGKAVLEAAAKSNLKKVTLELGGKSLLIIFDDPDVASAAQAAAKSILLNSGQACIASSRGYVHDSIAEAFSKQLVQVLKHLGSNPEEDNNPLSLSTRRGPQATRGQFTSTLGYFDEVKQAGYKIISARKQEGRKGFFIEPTVIFKADEESRVMKEEVFGPVICLSVFGDEKEVLKCANDGAYGL
ncbi:hypothetical protein LTR13_011430 [Exophiala sideris]|uniref:aldehyde dehydrogenase (NAD(+)) n=1 Tax=Exophiala sideris TaxID=1016849 RepID=A0ABR0IU36_9EURO|nr:hypothetical protein LTR13_011430 [Exophiala sideris]KAK5048102.1 hypothetical protein LTR69_011465 [Exophiala sideris]KAK5175978.1 hypothetical protein LTR44_011464 [Eurotiomycetes sp. CCFEE 6388]